MALLDYIFETVYVMTIIKVRLDFGVAICFNIISGSLLDNITFHGIIVHNYVLLFCNVALI